MNELEETLPSVPKDEKLPRGSGTILVVEDELGVRNFAAKVLREQGYTVWEAANGQEAVDFVQGSDGEKIQLVMTDMVMPVAGGRYLVDQMKTIYPDIRVIFSSGYMESMIEHENFLQKGEVFLQKPFSPQSLVRKVHEVLNL